MQREPGVRGADRPVTLIDEQHREVPLGRALSVKPSLTPVSQL